MTETPLRGYRFDGFRIDVGSRELIGADGVAVALTGKAFDVLLYLAERPGQLVGKDELLTQVWAGRVVDENNLTQAVSALRKALGTGAGDHRYILTEARRGYRFVADLQPATVASPPPGKPVHEPSRTPYRMAAVCTGLLLLGWVLVEAGHVDTPAPPQDSAPVALAVLPFRALAGTHSDELLEQGMVETLVTRLAGSSTLRVRSPRSSQRISADTPDVLEAGRQLGVGFVLAGSTQRRGGQVRINARLLEVGNGKTLWAGTFDAGPAEWFDLQDRIAAAVASALKIEALPQHAASRCEGADPVAYRSYLTGRYHASRPDPQRLAVALASFQQAIERDPSCAPAYAGMASAYRGMVNIGERDPRQMFPLATAAAERALQLDRSSAEAHFAMASIQFRYGWDWAGAERSYRRALALNPSFADAHYGYANLLMILGRVDEALQHARQARQSDPLSPLANAIEGNLLSAAHRDDAAQAAFARALELQPEFWIALLYRGEAALASGNGSTAVVDLGRAAELSKGNTRALAMLGAAYAATGDRKNAESVLVDLRRRAAAGYQPATSQAAVQHALGHTAEALALLEKAHAQRDVRMSFLKVEPNWDDLRPHPGFRALMRRMNLQ